MTTIQRILLPLRLSPHGEVKLPLAEVQARAFGAEVLLLHVEPDRAGAGNGGVPPGTARARAYLDAAAASLRGAGITARTLVRVGGVVPSVLKSARDFNVDLIILGRSAPSGIRLSRGIAGAIMREAPCPVLLVPPDLMARAVVPQVRSFAADAARAGVLSPWPLGTRAVEVTRIVGSVGRHNNLRRNFQPRRAGALEEARQKAIRRAMEGEGALPAVQLYKLGYGYYVSDGHHRVAAARALGQEWIDAELTEYVPVNDASAQDLFSARRAFERDTGLLRVGATQAETYDRLRPLIDEHAKANGGHDAADLAVAARRWYAQEFRPVQLKLRAARLTEHFPGERTADLFVRLAELRRSPKGDRPDWDEVLTRFAAQHARGTSSAGAWPTDLVLPERSQP